VLGPEAKTLGIVSQVVPLADLMKASMETAAQIAQYPTLGVALTKKLVYRSMLEDVSNHYDWEKWAAQLTMAAMMKK
jgi:enoyl-CoA hydratase/carnithine racemase